MTDQLIEVEDRLGKLEKVKKKEVFSPFADVPSPSGSAPSAELAQRKRSASQVEDHGHGAELREHRRP